MTYYQISLYLMITPPITVSAFSAVVVVRGSCVRRLRALVKNLSDRGGRATGSAVRARVAR